MNADEVSIDPRMDAVHASRAERRAGSEPEPLPAPPTSTDSGGEL